MKVVQLRVHVTMGNDIDPTKIATAVNDAVGNIIKVDDVYRISSGVTIASNYNIYQCPECRKSATDQKWMDSNYEPKGSHMKDKPPLDEFRCPHCEAIIRVCDLK